MPFTFCHPAIILPLTRISKNKISATGLIIGSMAPDFEYFIKMRLESIHGHTLAGLFYFDLPLTLLLAFVYQLFVRDALVVHLPNPFQQRFKPHIGFNWLNWVKQRWYVLLYSALLGIFAHVFWDAFTHWDGYFVRKIPALHGYTTVFGVTFGIPNLLQLVSTVIGGVVILLYLIWPIDGWFDRYNWLRKFYYWFTVLGFTALTLWIRNGNSLGDFIATSIAGFLLGILFTSLIFTYTTTTQKE